MRKRDLHILTSNIYTYTGDQRFSVIHAPDSEDWDLKIEYPQKKDEGIYECQVNTEPKINLAVLLHVTGTSTCLDLVFRTHRHKIAPHLLLDLSRLHLVKCGPTATTRLQRRKCIHLAGQCSSFKHYTAAAEAARRRELLSSLGVMYNI